MRHSAYSKYYDAYKLFEKKLEKNKRKKNLRILHIHCMRKIAHVWNIAIV